MKDLIFYFIPLTINIFMNYIKTVEKHATKTSALTVANAIKNISNITKCVCEHKIRQITLKERIEWALTKPPQIKKIIGTTILQQKKEAEKKEKAWGNCMIHQTNNGQWTTLLGENLVYDILQLRGENPKKVSRKNGFEPDWETDKYMYEVKTSNWCVSGTAGEKVYGTFIKYQNIPELYGKPLRIVCVANQEEELTNGKTVYFGENVTEKTQQLLNLAKVWGIEYIKFSELALSVSHHINNS
jgi:hypothetical protein